jgi:hypothetical protein
MITTTTKNEIFNKLQFYYSHTTFSINGLQYTFANDYNNESEFEQALYKVNTQIFFRDLLMRDLRARSGKTFGSDLIEIIDIPEIIKTEYRLFSRNKTKAENENWLNHTYNVIININNLSRFIGKSDRVVFLDWSDTMIIKQPENKDGKDEPKKELHNNIFELKQNNFDEVNPEKVIEHFKILHENGYISKENFELFIKTRFADNKNLTDKIELLKENSRVQFKKIFYKYYDTVINQKYGKKPKYVNLLCENFTGFDYDAISTNFSD